MPVRQFAPGVDPMRTSAIVMLEDKWANGTVLHYYFFDQDSDGEQADFVIRPAATRYYEIRTFGVSDTVMVLFESENGELKYRSGDDDSGEDYNASLRIKLVKEHRYVLRIRLYWSDETGRTAVMMW